MNHWFLCGRDVMWFCVGSIPIVLGFASNEVLSLDDSDGAFFLVILSFMVQWVLIFALYFKVII